MIHDIGHIKQVRAGLRKTYGGLFDRIAARLFEADPIGISFGFNTDEYETEVDTILPRLHLATNARDVEVIIHQEFCRWFDAECVGPQARYHAIANQIWEEWHAFCQSSA
jgi:hypothetical protein